MYHSHRACVCHFFKTSRTQLLASSKQTRVNEVGAPRGPTRSIFLAIAAAAWQISLICPSRDGRRVAVYERKSWKSKRTGKPRRSEEAGEYCYQGNSSSFTPTIHGEFSSRSDRGCINISAALLHTQV